MALNFQGLFPQARGVLTSFDFIDLVSGQGYGNFYLVTGLNDSAANERFLYPNKIRSEETAVSVSNTGQITTDTKVGEENWDLTVGVNQTIEGTATIKLRWLGSLNVGISGKDNHFKCYMIVKIIRERNSAETAIGTAQTGEVFIETSTTGTTTVNNTDLLKLDCTRTSIAKGDILRVSVEKWIKEQQNIVGGGNPGTGTITYNTDPEDISESTPADSRNFQVNIPFRIDI